MSDAFTKACGKPWVDGQQKPFSLRVSVTDACQLSCVYCKPYQQDAVNRGNSSVMTFHEILCFTGFVRSRFGLDKVRITGGEPLLRKGLVKFVEQLRGQYVGDIALTTNGQLLKKYAKELRKAGLGRLNVSLDSLDPVKFNGLTGGELSRTLDGVDAALDAGFAPPKLNAVAMRGVNDNEFHKLVAYGLAHGCEVRFIELMRANGCGNTEDYTSKVITAEQIREMLSPHYSLSMLEYQPGITSRNYLVESRSIPGLKGTVGFISSRSHPFCNSCRRLRLTSKGELIGCLNRNERVGIREFMADGRLNEAGLLGALTSSLSAKAKSREHESLDNMVAIGG